MRPIDADALVEAIKDYPYGFRGMIYDDINAQPTIDVPDRKVGKWIYPTDIDGFGRCENCKALWDVSLIRNKFFKHCPRCGHQMERNAEILKMANEQVDYLSAERSE